MSNNNVYLGEFKNWEDVQKEFRTDHKEPDEVILAVYDQDYYDGAATVIAREGSKYFIVQAGHCSCYGLEDQFEPTYYNSKKLLVECLKRTTLYGVTTDVKEAVIERLSK